MGYPIHNYGSDQIRSGVQSWIQGKAQKQAAILQAIMQTAPYMKEFSPGSPAYQKVKDAYGGQVAGAMSEQASVQREQMIAKTRIDAFDRGIKAVDGLASLEKAGGPGAYKSPTYKGIAQMAEESFKKAGIDFKYNNLLSHKENMEVLNQKSIDSINKMVESMGENPSVSQLRLLETAVTKYKSSPFSDKKTADSLEKLVEWKQKRIAKQEEERRKKAEKNNKNVSGIKKEYDDFFKTANSQEYKDKNGNATINLLEYQALKEKAKRDPVVAATSLAQKNMLVQLGKKDLGEAVQNILDVWKSMGYIEGGGQKKTGAYSSAEDVGAAYKAGKITKEAALAILKNEFGFE